MRLNEVSNWLVFVRAQQRVTVGLLLHDTINDTIVMYNELYADL